MDKYLHDFRPYEANPRVLCNGRALLYSDGMNTRHAIAELRATSVSDCDLITQEAMKLVGDSRLLVIVPSHTVLRKYFGRFASHPPSSTSVMVLDKDRSVMRAPMTNVTHISPVIEPDFLQMKSTLAHVMHKTIQ